MIEDIFGGTWPTFYGWLRHPQLAQALHDLAAEWARRALEQPGVDESALDTTVRMAAMGQASELLVKSTLAGINPVLLADKANMATLLKLTDNPTDGALGKMTTVGAQDAVKRLNECRPRSTPEISQPTRALEVRNDAIHLGLAPRKDELDAALNELVRLAEQVFEVRKALGQSHDWSEFWSAKHIQIVEARQRAFHQQLVEHYQDLIATAQESYRKMTEYLSKEAKNRLVAELASRVPFLGEREEVRRHTCPACANTMWVIYDVQRDVDIDDSEMPSGGSSIPHGYSFYARVHARVASALCPVCRLALDQSDLLLTDIPYTLDLGVREATEEEEQAWRDADNAGHPDR